jgi:hypothetical protein
MKTLQAEEILREEFKKDGQVYSDFQWQFVAKANCISIKAIESAQQSTPLNEGWITIYGIHTGCQHEGGRAKRKVFLTIEEARKECLWLVAEEQKEIQKMYGDDPDELRDFTWHQRDENLWENCIDEIRIIEFQVASPTVNS